MVALDIFESFPKIVHKDQAGFVPKRSIFDQIRQAQMMIKFAEAEEVNGVIIALDQEKAYDKIKHDYLWKVLQATGIPEHFIFTIQHLYQDAQTVVFINGEQSSPFTVTRGVRQGCPLSCLVFDIAIEPLANLLRNSDLKGFEIPGMTERLIVGLFADDTTVYLSEDDSIATLHKILARWTLAVGAKFNEPNTKIIPIGTKDYRRKVLEQRKINNWDLPLRPGVEVMADGIALRILGAWLGNDVDDDLTWDIVIKKVEEKLERWSRCHPSTTGKCLIAQLVVGGQTQFLTKAQGMSRNTETRLNRILTDFVWEGNPHYSIDKETLRKPGTQEGINLLDVAARNRAIQIV